MLMFIEVRERHGITYYRKCDYGVLCMLLKHSNKQHRKHNTEKNCIEQKIHFQ